MGRKHILNAAGKPCPTTSTYTLRQQNGKGTELLAAFRVQNRGEQREWNTSGPSSEWQGNFFICKSHRVRIAKFGISKQHLAVHGHIWYDLTLDQQILPWESSDLEHRPDSQLEHIIIFNQGMFEDSPYRIWFIIPAWVHGVEVITGLWFF